MGRTAPHFSVPLARIDRAEDAGAPCARDSWKAPGFAALAATRQPGEREGFDLIRLDPERGAGHERARRDGAGQDGHQRRVADATAAHDNIAR